MQTGLAGPDPCMKQGNPNQISLYLQWLVGCGQGLGPNNAGLMLPTKRCRLSKACLLSVWLCSFTYACDFAYLTRCCKAMMFCKRQCCHVLQGQAAFGSRLFSLQHGLENIHAPHGSTRGLPKGAHLGRAATTSAVASQADGWVSLRCDLH